MLYNGQNETLKINNAKLALETGKTGLFEFTIYPEHPYYDEVVEMLGMVEVHRNDEVLFYGRVLNVEIGFYNEKQVSCEGELAFLLDSLIPPHTWGSSFSGYFANIIGRHNSQVEYDKRFEVGVVTLADFLPFDVVENLEYINALDTLNKRMVVPYDGYLSVRHENGTKYLDLLSYTADITNVSTQEIRLGKNLLDCKKTSNNEDVFSGIVPLGAKEEGSEIRIDVFNVNGGSVYVTNADAVALYGTIYKQVIFENITNSRTLLETAKAYLAQNYAGISTVEITAADLATSENNLDSFKVGQWVNVYDNLHFSESPQMFLIRKITIDLLNPAKNKITIGKTKKGLTESLSDSAKESSTSPVVETEQPYLVDSGTTNIWTWKTFSDNTCEFFAKIPIDGLNVNAALGNWYRSEVVYGAYQYAYPLVMTEAPAINMMFQTRNSSAALLWAFSQDAYTAQEYLPQCYLIRPTTGSNLKGNINIIGKGKI